MNHITLHCRGEANAKSTIFPSLLNIVEMWLKNWSQASGSQARKICQFLTSLNLSYLTARPKSAIAQVQSLLTRMFLLLMSRWAMPDLPRVPKISVCRWAKPLEAVNASLPVAVVNLIKILLVFHLNTIVTITCSVGWVLLQKIVQRAKFVVVCDEQHLSPRSSSFNIGSNETLRAKSKRGNYCKDIGYLYNKND